MPGFLLLHFIRFRSLLPFLLLINLMFVIVCIVEGRLYAEWLAGDRSITDVLPFTSPIVAFFFSPFLFNLILLKSSNLYLKKKTTVRELYYE